ncbi:transcription termination/antitermination protein NusA [Mycoplasma sp. 1654_15]|uniref:transcription termination/antitermination protein NusA n=1 Tax=Mycoplasma sp. 1654_15 TaxID=2725994 RepID=UPI0014495FB9|nr:transcription termination/antitermination protein NusA [Mycoplasma sp. 1654_15]QJB71115.1 transcription termination/antitermination protein NusA [Mycoplasma sp. 1654_15]
MTSKRTKKEQVSTIKKFNFQEILQDISEFRKIDFKIIKDILQDSISRQIISKLDPDAEIELLIDEKNPQEFSVINKNGVIVSDQEFEDMLNESSDLAISDNSDKHTSFQAEKIAFIPLSIATKINKKANVGDVFDIPIDISEFDKHIFVPIIQTFKQKIHEFTRKLVYQKFLPLKNTIIKATLIKKSQNGFNFLIEGEIPAYMPKPNISNFNIALNSEQEVFIEDVLDNQKDSQIILSSKEGMILKEKLKREIPEVEAGILEIVNVAREAGNRSKVSVRKVNEDDLSQGVDEIGALIGKNGSRIATINKEMLGEKIDIVKYDPNITRYIINALSPSRVIFIEEIKKSKGQKFLVVVPTSHQAKAIGKHAINVRLANELTRTKIDVKSYKDYINEGKTITNWNGNIENQAELERIEKASLVSHKTHHHKPHTYTRRSFSNTNIMAEFEKDIEKYIEDLQSERLLYEESESEENEDFSVIEQPKPAVKTKKNKDKFDVDNLLDQANEEFEKVSETAQEQPKEEPKKQVDLTKEEIKQIKKEAKFFKKDNDLLSYSGIKDLDLGEFNWDEDEEE